MVVKLKVRHGIQENGALVMLIELTTGELFLMIPLELIALEASKL